MRTIRVNERHSGHTWLWIAAGAAAGVALGVIIAEKRSGRKLTLRGLVARGRGIADSVVENVGPLVETALALKESWSAAREADEEDLDEEELDGELDGEDDSDDEDLDDDDLDDDADEEDEEDEDEDDEDEDDEDEDDEDEDDEEPIPAPKPAPRKTPPPAPSKPSKAVKNAAAYTKSSKKNADTKSPKAKTRKGD